MNFVIMCCPGREDLVPALRSSLAGHIVVETWDTKREGAMVGAMRAFQLGLDCFKDQPFTVLQDDAEVCAHFGDYVAQFMGDVRECGIIIQWYAHGWVAPSLAKVWELLEKRGTARMAGAFEEFGGHDYVCSLATTYPHEWAEKIYLYLRDQVDHDGQKDDQGRMHGDDAAIADVLAYHRKEFYVHVPSLVQHIGHVSMVAGRSVTLESHDARTSRCYVGKDFDARSIVVTSMPWREPKEKETNMDEEAKTEKKVGEMTVRELYDAMASLDAETTDEQTMRTQDVAGLLGPPTLLPGDFAAMGLPVAPSEEPPATGCHVPPVDGCQGCQAASR